MQRIAKTGASTFVITNNHYLGKGVVNALQLIHMLAQTAGRCSTRPGGALPELVPITTTREITPSLFPK